MSIIHHTQVKTSEFIIVFVPLGRNTKKLYELKFQWLLCLIMLFAYCRNLGLVIHDFISLISIIWWPKKKLYDMESPYLVLLADAKNIWQGNIFANRQKYDMGQTFKFSGPLVAINACLYSYVINSLCSVHYFQVKV